MQRRCTSRTSCGLRHIFCYSRPSPSVATVASSMSHACPNQYCSGVFGTTEQILQHLNNPHLSCTRYNPSAEFTAPPPQTQAPPVKAFRYHPNSSWEWGREQNTFEKMDDSEYGELRTKYPYYPFRDQDDFNMGRFCNSKLSKTDVDRFLKLQWVRIYRKINTLLITAPDAPSSPLLQFCIQITVVDRDATSYTSVEGYDVPCPGSWHCISYKFVLA
jgi:hypothetical protein